MLAAMFICAFKGVGSARARNGAGDELINRLSGVVLAALAVQFIITGVTNAFGAS